MKHLLLIILITLSFAAKAQTDTTVFTRDLSRMESAFQMLKDPDKRNCIVMLQSWIDKQNELLPDNRNNRIDSLIEDLFAKKHLYDGFRKRFFEVCDKQDKSEARAIVQIIGRLSEQINEISLQIQDVQPISNYQQNKLNQLAK